ncbi:hypothetical protein [Pseudomonas sp. CCC3.1]|uniref:hypothetical protein n=1 Tax=Pseudomonas sp. CCC3.1 TaxID=3048607 RepID=UPI002AC93D3F|nr:hypothetical protein [Pseudomonas sp. CCC3.1]MEB0207854.1 hypothetical protein [Pseudomonas sp. CCC3.1]WPX34726.1 hypothetical protein RHM56_15580 [Pseudomonas sp. CCC3.1]
MSRSQPPFRFSLTLDGFTGEDAISTPYARSSPSQRQDSGLLLAHVQQGACS